MSDQETPMSPPARRPRLSTTGSEADISASITESSTPYPASEPTSEELEEYEVRVRRLSRQSSRQLVRQRTLSGSEYLPVDLETFDQALFEVSLNTYATVKLVDDQNRVKHIVRGYGYNKSTENQTQTEVKECMEREIRGLVATEYKHSGLTVEVIGTGRCYVNTVDRIVTIFEDPGPDGQYSEHARLAKSVTESKEDEEKGKFKVEFDAKSNEPPPPPPSPPHPPSPPSPAASGESSTTG